MKRPTVYRNDHSSIAVPAIGSWTPRLSVSVVIPAHGHQDKLDLVLAALAAQTYPAELLEVVVVDDNSTPALLLPEIRPANTRIVKPDSGWGSANAVNLGVVHSGGEVILRLDSDMVTFADHVESQLRWHHRLDYAAVLGHKLFVDYVPGEHSPARVHELATADAVDTLYAGRATQRQWTEKVIDATDMLRRADHTEAYRVFVGATGSVHRTLFDATGGLDAIPLGGDSVFGYRLAQAGAVFIPDHDSSSWHLGLSQMHARREAGIRYRTPFVANRVPEYAPRRAAPGQQWEVPLVDVVVDAADATAGQLEESVTALLGGTTPDVRVTLLADWPDPDARHQTLDDPQAELRLIQETYRAEPRVRFASAATEPDPAVPYRLLLPAAARLRPDAVAALLAVGNGHQVGLVTASTPSGTIRWERHAAFARARHLATPGRDLDSLVDGVAGVLAVAADRITLRPGAEGRPTPLRPGKSTLTRRVARRLLPTALRRRLRRLVS